MGLFSHSVWECIRRDKVKLRGSNRTKRLRKKRSKHFDELYVKYRDEIFMEDFGMTFLEWRDKKDKEKDQRFMEKYGMSFKEYELSKKQSRKTNE